MALCPSLHAVAKIAKNWRNRSFLLKLSQVVKEIEGCPAKTRLAIFRNKRKIAIFAAACKPGHKCMARFSWIRVKVKQGNVKLCHEPLMEYNSSFFRFSECH